MKRTHILMIINVAGILIMSYFVGFLTVLAILIFLSVFPTIGYLIEKHKISYFIKNWQQFAEANFLHFEAGKNRTKPVISGDFCGHFLSIHYESESNDKGGVTHTRYTIFNIKRNQKVSNFKKSQADKDIMRSFWAIYNNMGFGIRVESTFKKIVFNSELIESIDILQSISDQLVELIEICPEVCKMGGEVVDSLLQAKPFKPVISQIIKNIADETAQRIKPKASLLLCKKCLTFCSSHKAKPPLSFSSALSMLLTGAEYYGCRLCKQSRDFIEGRSVAVLDNLMTEEWSLHDVISVNWLAHRKPFDFHEVRIMQASDREVEEFVMQVGNDMDEFRQPRYKEMPCIISSGCKLSANTRNLLKHTFKSVKET